MLAGEHPYGGVVHQDEAHSGVCQHSMRICRAEVVEGDADHAIWPGAGELLEGRDLAVDPEVAVDHVGDRCTEAVKGGRDPCELLTRPVARRGVEDDRNAKAGGVSSFRVISRNM